MTLNTAFPTDRDGRRFTDVMSDPRIKFADVLDFFDNLNRQQRMMDSEEHHDRPPLAGVIKEFEKQPFVATFLSGNDSHETIRFRQAVGIIVRIIMEHHGWRTTGNKGSLGQRAKVPAGITAPGAYHNTSGLSKWFVRTERYTR